MADAAEALDGVGGVRLRRVDAGARFILRGEVAAAAARRAFGIELPHEPCRAISDPTRAALWLGPDEWLLLAPDAETAMRFAALEATLADIPHALVDVSRRQVAVLVDGPGAAQALNAGVPLDLSLRECPVGFCARTIFEKIEIILWRTAPEAFHLEVWRSFAPYLTQFLDNVRAENR